MAQIYDRKGYNVPTHTMLSLWERDPNKHKEITGLPLGQSLLNHKAK